MKNETYIKMTQPFRDNPDMAKGIHIANKFCTGVMYLAYPILLAYLFFFGKYSSYFSFWKALFVPGISFVLLSVGRAFINRPRPYEAFEVPPVIPKDTKGHSFPSRHVFSATMIAVTFILMSPWSWLGVIFLMLSFALAAIRVVSGVHYISDVVAGIIVAVVAGLAGYLEMTWLLVAFAVVVAVFFLVLFILARYAVRPKVHTIEHEMTYLDKYDFMQGESREITNEHTIETYDGQKLWVGFVPGDPNNKHYVILSHGYTSTRYGMYKYAALWRKLGYNCVIYDNRGHGVNAPTTITFGVREGKDLMAVIADTYERYGQDIHLGLHGESMGAGLQVMALAYGPKVDFIVNDCGYSEVLPVLRYKVNGEFGLPGWFADAADAFCKLFFGYSFNDARPIEHLKENEIPICFVHGTNDTFTAHWHSEKMYEANKGYKELHLFEGVDHARCVKEDSERYLKMMKAFVEKVYE